MNLNNKIHNIETLDDLDSLNDELTNRIDFTRQKMRLHSLAFQYMLNPANIMDMVIKKTSAQLFKIIGRWLGKRQKQY